VRPLGGASDALVRVGAGGRRVAVASRRPLGGLRLELSGEGTSPVIAGARVDEEAAIIE
jgi:hypothetical protein